MKKLFYFGFVMMVVTACTSDEWFGLDDTNSEYPQTTRASLNEEFLDVEETSIQKFTHKDWETFIKASTRLTVSVQKDGQYLICEKTGKEVNISDKLFNFIKQSYENSNKVIAQNSIRIPRKKRSATESNNPTGSTHFDCVGEAIAHYLTIDVSDVNDSLSRVFPTYAQNGIHRDSLLDAVKLFKPDASKQSKFVESDPVNITYINGVAAISGHAVNTASIVKHLNHYHICLVDYRVNDVYSFIIRTYSVPAISYDDNITLIFQYIK